ncbi:MAG: addiction module protein [Syntrophobacterales bacterium]|nr:addiction module protein [Syntrophobacterales bacterium]
MVDAEKYSESWKEAESLPVQERAMVVDSLLRMLNPADREFENEWIKVARRRLAELRSGRIKSSPGEGAFAQIRERFAK